MRSDWPALIIMSVLYCSFPVALVTPLRPYTPMRGALSTVWFDRHKISRDSPEHLESVNAMCGALGRVIEEEVKAGVPKHRMIIGNQWICVVNTERCGIGLVQLFASLCS